MVFSKYKSAVEIHWAGATNSTAAILSGNGFMDLRTDGNSFINNATTPTGDVLFSTKNFADGGIKDPKIKEELKNIRKF